MREAIGLGFDFEWTNKNIMYSAYKRVVSYFPNTAMEAKGKPGPDELTLLEPFRDKLSPSVFGEPYTPPVSDGSGSDRTLLKQAYDLLLVGGLQARRRTLEAAERQAADDRVPRFVAARCSPTPCRSSRTSASSASRPICASSTPRNTRAAPTPSISTS